MSCSVWFSERGWKAAERWEIFWRDRGALTGAVKWQSMGLAAKYTEPSLSVIPGTNEGQSQITFMLHIDYVWKEADLSVGVLHHYRHYLMLTENCLIAFITSDSLADAIYQTAPKTDFHHLNITYNGLWRLWSSCPFKCINFNFHCSLIFFFKFSFMYLKLLINFCVYKGW